MIVALCLEEYEKETQTCFTFWKFAWVLVCKTAFLWGGCQYMFFVLAGGGEKGSKHRGKV